MLDADVLESDSLDMEQISEQWRTRFRTLFLHKIEAIFEIAKEIAAFHEEYNADPSIWRASWSVVCKQIVGIGASACSHYETIHRAFSSPKLSEYRDLWPAHMYSLYKIARAFETHERTVFKALAGTITPSMTQEAAQELLELAEADAEVKGPDFLYGEKKKPKRAKPKTWRKYDRPEETQSEDSPDDTQPEDTQAEGQSGEDDFLSDASIRAAITAEAKIEESDKCLFALTDGIKEYGDGIEDEVMRQILTARADHANFFAFLGNIDSRYKQMAVTMALRKLGY